MRNVAIIFMGVVALTACGQETTDSSLNAAEPYQSALALRTNTTDIDLALSSGIQALEQNLDPGNGYAPYFEIFADKGRAYTPHLASNVAGKSLYALTVAHAALGRDPRRSEAVRGLREYVTRMMYRPRNGKANDLRPDNMMATSLPGDKETAKSKGFTRYYISNLGAGMRGLLGLQDAVEDAEKVDGRYGRSSRGLFDVSIYNLAKYYVEGAKGEKTFDWEAFRARLGLKGGRRVGLVEDSWSGAFQNNVPPLVLDALVEYAERRPGKGKTDELIKALKEYGLNGMYPQGKETSKKHGHMYEVTAGINAFARLASREGDKDLAERMRAYFDGLFVMGAALESGWVAERFYGVAAGIGKEGERLNSDVGELNNTAQLIEAALRFGDLGLGAKYYQYAERALRGHVLPAQLLDADKLVTAPGLGQKIKGSFGFPAPYGVQPQQKGYFVGGYFADVTAGTVATLARVKGRAHQVRGKDLYIPLLLDLKTKVATVATPYAGGKDFVITTAKGHDRIFVRRPSWAKAVQGEGVELTDEWIVVRTNGKAATVRLTFELTETETTEDLNGRRLTTVWLGDSVYRMTNFGTKQAFYPEP